ncbi:MAG: hypothetical protein L3J69_11450 [Desulfobacula sp.]|nr:hypothetical protein [Desulfobacula sp.]
MEIKFTCKNNNCSHPGNHQFEMTFDEETIMDAKNMASIFCPFCKAEMFPASAPDNLDGPNG